jgi:hypothetical protein
VIILPSIETVVVLVPRTGSGSLKRAILDRYQDAMPIYRHMEADGVPAGYDRWRRVGVCRHPVDRLWSLYKFCQSGGGTFAEKWPELFAQRTASVDRSFSTWITKNDLPFSGPYDTARGTDFYPGWSVRHYLPENRKSQFVYLRPDLGTEVFRFDEMHELAAELDVRLVEHANGTAGVPPPELDAAAAAHVRKFFAWDLAFGGWSL